MFWLYMALTQLDTMCKLYGSRYLIYTENCTHTLKVNVFFYRSWKRFFYNFFFCDAEIVIWGLRSSLSTLKDWLHKWKIEKDHRLIFSLRKFSSFKITLSLWSIRKKKIIYLKNQVTFMSTVFLTGPVFYFPAWVRINISTAISGKDVQDDTLATLSYTSLFSQIHCFNTLY